MNSIDFQIGDFLQFFRPVSAFIGNMFKSVNINGVPLIIFLFCAFVLFGILRILLRLRTSGMSLGVGVSRFSRNTEKPHYNYDRQGRE